MREDGLGQDFNTEAQAGQGESGDDGGGDDDRDLRKSWKDRAQEMGQKRRRGRGYGMRRDGN